jgi:hypothetical protein
MQQQHQVNWPHQGQDGLLTHWWDHACTSSLIVHVTDVYTRTHMNVCVCVCRGAWVTINRNSTYSLSPSSQNDLPIPLDWSYNYVAFISYIILWGSSIAWVLKCGGRGGTAGTNKQRDIINSYSWVLRQASTLL